ncbi:MAG: molybdenum cofactor biosynthesis protein MoaE [Candidatus Dadabacteria bacterium]|nr:molybdenum cofactor biosynthesis protein MoaE [Candidatus Dadabacteria bacterium]
MSNQEKIEESKIPYNRNTANFEEQFLTEKNIDNFELSDIPGYKVGTSGASFIFSGIVRSDRSEKGIVSAIIYECYKDMAEKEIEKIRSETLKKFAVNMIYIKHRIGRVYVGESSLIVAVLSAHRKEGIKAVDYIIDEIKKKVPIWKKEIFEDGTHRWVKGNV